MPIDWVPPTDHGVGDPQDTLPDDEDEAARRGDYVQVASFKAAVRGSRILQGGETGITLGVPIEWKYDALPITDYRGVLFQVEVWAPMPRSHNGDTTTDPTPASPVVDDGGGSEAGDGDGGSSLAYLHDPFRLSD